VPPTPRSSFARLAGEAREAVSSWCEGRSAVLRAPLLLWLAWVGVQHLRDTDYQSLFFGLNLGIHEGGHLLFSWQPFEFLTVAGGTLLQLAVPVLSAMMFARQPDYFASAFCGGWLSMNLYNVATYMADARELDLPLVNVGGGEGDHDWNYMLAAVGLLEQDTRLAALVRVAAFLVMWGSVAAGAWMLWRMARSAPARA
jgi:hypothetical protein